VRCPAHIRIGTRGSRLAVAQAQEVKNRLLGAFPDQLTQAQIEIVKIMTTGDKIQDRHLADIGGKGLFTKEIEEGLSTGQIDLAVHSMKDMPADLPEGLSIPCILEREDPRDAFISLKYKSVKALPEGAVIGTSSVRRQAQLLALRPDLRIVPFRGNVLTRLEKLESGVVDATFLAVAGLKRLELADRITAAMDPADMLPAVAQGAIGVEVHIGNEHIRHVLAEINHEPSFICISAERAFLFELGGSCTTPMGCLATLSADEKVLSLAAMVASVDGKITHHTTRKGSPDDAARMGRDAGQELKTKGASFLNWKH
jgi:hydroxymethylbilane synthase